MPKFQPLTDLRRTTRPDGVTVWAGRFAGCGCAFERRAILRGGDGPARSQCRRHPSGERPKAVAR